MKNRVIAIFMAMSLLAGAAAAQEISEKQELSIFRLNYYGAPPAPERVNLEISAQIGDSKLDIRLQGSGNPQTDRIFQDTISGVDAQIRQVFQNLGRFTIRSYPQRLESSSLSAFIDEIQRYREAQVEIPEAVRLGQQAFTEADLRQLVDSFIIVVPSVSYYQLNRDDSGNWESGIVTNFSIVNVQNYESLAEFSVESSGYDTDPREAMRDAVDGIAGQLNFEIRSIEEFRIRTAVLDRNGSRLVLALGSNMGIQVGDEYEITRFAEVAGYQYARRIALLRIREVNREYSVAQIIYEESSSVIGDEVREVPRIGVDSTPYISALVPLADPLIESLALGVKVAPNRGFYAFRPLVGIEVLLSQASTAGPLEGLPVSVNLGAEYNVFLRRLRFIPQAYLGIIGQIPFQEGEDFSFRAIKTTGMLGISYLLPGMDDGAEVYLETGYEIQFGLAGPGGNIQGIVFGIGARFR